MSQKNYLDLAGLTVYDSKIKQWIKSSTVDITNDEIKMLFPIIQPNNEIWYTSSDGNVVTPYVSDVFGANIVSNTYENGKGIIKFDNSITNIGERAFQSCNTFTSVTIPNSVTSIGRMAFWNCSSLTSIAIADGVMSIGDQAFSGCRSLTSITIPNSVTSIGPNAFYNCKALTSVTIPNSVTSIGNWAFSYCSSITSITIPESVTSIGKGAFQDCSSTTSIVVESGNTTYDSRDNCNAIIETATNTLIAGCQNTVIPDSVTSIGDQAFSGCRSLTSITIPERVTSIGSRAFSGCRSLTSITIPERVTSIGDYAFNSCKFTSITCEAITPPTLGLNNYLSTVKAVYVPAESVDAYKTATHWSYYADIIQPIQ